MAHTFGPSPSTRTSSAGNPITTAGFTVDRADTVVVLLLKVNGATNRAGGAPTMNGVEFTQANVTQKAVTSPEASCELWYLENPCDPHFRPNAFPPGSYAVTIPNTGGLTVFYTLATGRARPGAGSRLDVAGGSNATSANPSAGALVTTADGDIGFAVCASGLTDFDPATPSHTGFGTGTGTPLGTFDDGAHGGGQQYALQASKGSITMGWTVGSDDWGCVAAFFQEVLPHSINNLMSPDGGDGVWMTEKAGFR